MLLRPLLAGCTLGLLASTAGAHPAAPADLSRLAWMAGCWRMEHGARVVEEQWMEPHGRMMPGMGRTSVGGEVRAFEHMLVRQDEGGLVFHARPSGQAAAEFHAVEQTDTSVTFANPAHDFPQRIHYQSAAGGDSLLARIEGERNGTRRAVHFPYARVACPR